MSDPADDGMLVDRSTEVGSAALAAALKRQDVAAIGQALRHDYVVVPQLRTETGDLQVRVFESEHPLGATPYELCLFSSTETLAAYLGDNEDREFAPQRGPSLSLFPEQDRDLIERVVLDPAGPHPMKAVPGDVLWSLEPHPGDDDVAWVQSAPGGTLGEAELPLDAERSTVVGLDIALSRGWCVSNSPPSAPPPVARRTGTLASRELRAGDIGGRALSRLPPPAQRDCGPGPQRGDVLACPGSGHRRCEPS